MRALVIDDSRAVRAILSGMLKEMGFEVLVAPDGRQALSLLEERGAMDLALVDWNMPEMSGIDFLRAVRADARYAGMPVVMVTTETCLAHMTAALEAGANEYVMKPFTKEIIQDKLALLGIESGNRKP